MERKLKIIKRCIAEKKYSDKVNMESKLSKKYCEKGSAKINCCDLDINYLEVLQIVKKTGKVFSNKKNTDFSSNEIRRKNI